MPSPTVAAFATGTPGYKKPIFLALELKGSLTQVGPYEVVVIARGVDGVLNPDTSILASADTWEKIPGEVHCRCLLVNLGSG